LTGDYSVHLSDWPTLPEEYSDPALIAKVALVQDVIYLARSIRNKNKIKNRLPLRMLKIALSDHDGNAAIEEFKEIILEELNVKNIEILDHIGDIAEVKYEPDFNEIRSRYPDRIPEIIKAVKTGRFELREREVLLTADGDGVRESFHPDIILVSYRAKEGQHVASNHGVVVSLDLTLTEELKQEGLARDMVRHIQDARKQIGCDITDRIVLEFAGNIPKPWMDYICKETMGRMEEIQEPDTVIRIHDEEAGEISVKIKRISNPGVS
jgi:isoleucyl-tRNA synthetase